MFRIAFLNVVFVVFNCADAEFSNTAKQTLTFVLDIHMHMSDEVKQLQKGIITIANTAPKGFFEFQIVPYQGDSIDETLPANIARDIKDLELADDLPEMEIVSLELEKTIEALENSRRKSIVFVFAKTLWNDVDRTFIFEKAKKKQIVMHYFVSQCNSASPGKKLIKSIFRHGHSLNCISTDDVRKAMDYIAKLTSGDVDLKSLRNPRIFDFLNKRIQSPPLLFKPKTEPEGVKTTIKTGPSYQHLKGSSSLIQLSPATAVSALVVLVMTL